jgi:hypothetical protein
VAAVCFETTAGLFVTQPETPNIAFAGIMALYGGVTTLKMMDFWKKAFNSNINRQSP